MSSWCGSPRTIGLVPVASGGNIAFELDWEKLIENKRFYWVGAMQYTPRACRILITEKDRDEKLKPYLPAEGDGPWWADDEKDKHYWNGNYCLEFMLEDEIPLSSISELRFVRHHPVSTCTCRRGR